MSYTKLIIEVSTEEIDNTFRDFIIDKIPYLCECQGCSSSDEIMNYLDETQDLELEGYEVALDIDGTIPLLCAWDYIKDHEDKYKNMINRYIREYVESIVDFDDCKAYYGG